MDDVIEFMKKHKKYYQQYFIKDRLEKCHFGYTSEINQIYYHLGLTSIKSSEYYNFFEISEKYFNLQSKKVLEVACGLIPILSSIYKDKSIDITAIDRSILFKNYNDIKTVECNLEKKYDLSNFDLIIGFRLCNITENILELCYLYKKDFIFYLCPCIHKPLNNNITCNTYEQWCEYIKNKVKRFDDYHIKIFSSNLMPDSCPIIIGKYIKQKSTLH